MHKIMVSLLTSLLVMFDQASCQEKMPEPYCSIQDLPFDGHGWFGNASELDICFNENPIKTVIEVGSWLGCSTRYLAQKVGDNGKVYAIDTWVGSPTEAEHMRDPRLPYLYQLFLSNVKYAKLTHIIIPFRMNSQEAVKALNVMADLIYIDASHQEEHVYHDILAWNNHLNNGGIMCGDDWTWESVRRGVVRAAAVLNKRIVANGNFWKFVD